MKLNHMSPRTLRRAVERQAQKIASAQGVKETSQISEAQLAANRANAKLAHGATTPAGQKASSMNALRHGLTAKMALLPGDDGEHYAQLVASHVERHAPVGDEENELVHLIAENAWRMLKIGTEQEGVYALGRLENPDLFKEITDPVRRAALVHVKIGILYADRLRNLQLLERRIRNQHARDLAKLQAIQTQRIEGPQCEAEKTEAENHELVARIYTISNSCTAQSITFNPKEYGFVFSREEWEYFMSRNNLYCRATRKHLNLNKILSEYQTAEKAA